jgi:hypothetical protein
MSHMFFSQAIRPKIFSEWFATHPSIDERLASLTGRKAEASRPVPADADVARSMAAQVGNTTPQHVEQAARQLAAMPETLRRSLGSPEGARCAVYAYLIASDAKVRQIQLRVLVDAGDGAMGASIDALAKVVRELGPAARLPVLALALPALAQMDQPARDAFLGAVDGLVRADNEVTLDEFVIRTILRRQLSAKAAHAERARYRDIEAVKADALLLLATLARAGSFDPAAQKFAFARGAARLGLAEEIPPGAVLAADAMTAALDRLRQLTPLKKSDLVMACVDTALADDKLKVAEVELLRTIGMAIDCPLPPLLESHSVV